MKPGKIRIKDQKVYFEYYQLYKPVDVDIIYYHNNPSIAKVLKQQLQKDMEEYEASKQLIEVSNEYKVGNVYPDLVFIYIPFLMFEFKSKLRKAKNNQKCKAEITNNKAAIIELIK